MRMEGESRMKAHLLDTYKMVLVDDTARLSGYSPVESAGFYITIWGSAAEAFRQVALGGLKGEFFDELRRVLKEAAQEEAQEDEGESSDA